MRRRVLLLATVGSLHDCAELSSRRSTCVVSVARLNLDDEILSEKCWGATTLTTQKGAHNLVVVGSIPTRPTEETRFTSTGFRLSALGIQAP